VYIHGILRDEKGQKFSKSSGNNLSPIDIIKKYGPDALRLSLLIGIAPGNDARFYEEKVEQSRNFVNKLWNIGRYVNTASTETHEHIDTEKLTMADEWIINEFQMLIKEVGDDFDNFQFSQAAEKLREFTWNDFADWYIEISKFEENKNEKAWLLKNIFEDLLKMWHPFIPFVTENMWGNFGKKNLLVVEKWPSKSIYPTSPTDTWTTFHLVKEIIKEIRNGRLGNKIDPKKKIDVIIYAKNYSDNKLEQILKSQELLIKNLRTGIENLSIIDKKDLGESLPAGTSGFIQRVVGENIIWILLKNNDNLEDTEKEKAKAEKEIANLETFIAGLGGRLNNKDFVSKAPKNIIDQQKESLAKAQAELAELKKHLAALS